MPLAPCLAIALTPLLLAELPSAIALAPFETPRNGFFTGSVLVPGFEPAAPLEEGSLYVRARTAHSKSVEIESEHGVASRFNGLLHEWVAIDLAYAITRRVELGMRATVAGWDEQDDVFEVRGRSGRLIVRDEEHKAQGGKTARHDNVAEWLFRGKVALLCAPGDDDPSALSLALCVRLPIARQRDLTHAGTSEASLAVLGTIALGERVALHANLGGTVFFGEQRIFVEEGEFQEFLHAAAGATFRAADWLALGAQLEGNTPAIRHVNLMDGPVLSAAAGARVLLGGFVGELGGAIGLTRWSADQEMFASLGWVF
jgi:hypothetical protein